MGEGRRMEKEVVLPATPEQVWAAVATGPGISTWFVPHEVEERVDGRIQSDFGSGNVVNGRVLAWEPGKRFEYGGFEQPQPDVPNYAFEFLIEGRDEGSTVLRFVQSGFLDTDDWAAEYDSFDQGWDMFFHTLAEYLTHFAGRPVVNVVTMGYVPMHRDRAWARIYRALGLDGPHGKLAVGDPVTLRPDGPAPITGVVDMVTPSFLGARSADGLHRIGAEGEESCGVSAYHYFYRDDVDGAAATAEWQKWLVEVFPETG